MAEERPGGKLSARSKVDDHDWVRVAGDALARRGIEAVRVERLAKQLGISRGSFYWHFPSRDALLARLLDDWRSSSTLAIIARLETTGSSPHVRLRALLRIAFERTEEDRTLTTELAIRQWGRTDPRARKALEEVDRLRLGYFTKLFEEMDFSPEEARIRSALANSFMRVAPSFPDSRGLEDLDAALACLTRPLTTP
ncbi:TetR/AcrR family transcriptional regulator [Novosphingobium mangrovi (ex Hu et al. 2023)]|uniref:TetR/AcrR family transcriptional regulator n=1 Tax=Novosphingobium mangrovi (ex Hu et al. 2023) TaxID=2930094 RepID=A0ABT0AE07_9SPHN|nr:TetR/AcrR family transcriptional regulator [Novosphingobium mangrovi (ex Hu et al. 2023)]MCJ1961404.1 TetR/AcrR family transcriptional regulator [Novosphingobium mangrovi (ex Hu et al. 2023)]